MNIQVYPGKPYLEFSRKLIHLRKNHPAFCRRRWFQGQPIKGIGLEDIAWFLHDGNEMSEDHWNEDFAKSLGVFLFGRGLHAVGPKGEHIIDDSFYVIFNAHHESIESTLPTEKYASYAMPGMKVLQFAFGNNLATSDYIPHNYQENFVVYTGTHDNNTMKGWYRKDTSRVEKENLQRYFHQRVTADTVHTLLIRLALSSVARIAIIPLQDLLGLNEKARMNAPATTDGNWHWRLTHGQIDRFAETWLKEQTLLFNRA